jgi:hypothetical protein
MGVWRGEQCKMKVHPAMLMKTNRGGFAGHRCLGLGGRSGLPCDKGGIVVLQARHGNYGHKRRIIGERDIENEGSSGYVDENKSKQASDVGCQVSGLRANC